VEYETIIDMYSLDFEEFLWANEISEEIIQILRKCLEQEKSVPQALHHRIRNLMLQYSLIKKGSKASQFVGSLQWVEAAGIIARCYNLTLPELPLEGNSVMNVFKVYMKDMGLFVSMLEDGTQLDILQGRRYGYKGVIFDNLVADFFSKMGKYNLVI